MKALPLASTALLALMAMPVMAQEASSSMSSTMSSAESSVSAPAADAMGSVSDNTYGSLISAITTPSIVDLATVTDEAKVTIVLVSALQGNAASEAAGLDTALSANTEATTKLRTDVDANAAITAKLVAGGYTSADVVAVKSGADGSVIVYVDDRA